jgi:FemAB-related protein (PEP-CTERM system-associated)
VITVQQLSLNDPATQQRWDDFVYACPSATFFHRAAWQQLMHRVFKHRTYFLYAQANGEIQGVLPLAQVKSRLFGHALVGLPFAVYGGVAASNPMAADALETAAKRLTQTLGAEYLELRHVHARHPDWPKQDLYVTFRKEIFEQEEANLLAIPRKQRAMVRKGIKNALVCEVDASVDRFFSLYANNVHRHGTPALPKRYFEALCETFGSDCEVLTVVGPSGKPLSSVLTFYFRDEVMPYYAGDDESARDLAANDFKYWELMRRASSRGCRLFDYGRSKVGTGPYAFKKNWGFEPQALHYEFCLYKRDAIPQNNPNNAKYQLLIKAWRRLPLSWANALGPHIVRHLG